MQSTVGVQAASSRGSPRETRNPFEGTCPTAISVPESPKLNLLQRSWHYGKTCRRTTPHAWSASAGGWRTRCLRGYRKALRVSDIGKTAFFKQMVKATQA